MNSMRDTPMKRKRDPNFSRKEKALLLQLIGEFKIVTNSKTDGNTVLEKKKAWDEITKIFNSNSSEFRRDENTLKRAWDNMKAVAKKRKGTQHEPCSDCVLPKHAETEMVELITKTDPDLVKEMSNIDWTTPEGKALKKDIAVQVEEAQTNNGIHQVHLKRAIKPVRREVALRISHFKTKKRIMLNILKLKMETQLNKREASRMKREAASLKLAAAKLELQYQQDR